MADIQTQLPVKLTNGTNTAAITGGNALQVDGSAVIQPISGTVTANAGTGDFATNLVQISGSSVATAATGIQKVGIVDSSGNAISNGQKTMSNSVPVVLASDQTTINTSVGEISNGVVVFPGSSSAVADNATGTITYTVTTGKTLYLKQIIASSSGAPCKVVVDYGLTPTVIVVGFYSAASPVFPVTFAQPIPISSAVNVNVKITNHSGQSQDLYATIIGIEN